MNTERSAGGYGSQDRRSSSPAFGENAMSYSAHLFIGGLIAMGLDATGSFLLAVSHSGRGVFVAGT